jgi:TonB family protein
MAMIGSLVALLLAVEPALPAAMTPPEPLEMPEIAVPKGTELPGPVEIGVDITIDEKGAVTAADITSSGGETLDQAVLEGVKHFRFKPATEGGKPIAVRIGFTQRFEPPPALVEAAPDLDAVLEGTVIARGTRAPVKGAAVVATDSETKKDYPAIADAKGAFKIPVRSGVVLNVRVVAPEHEKFLQWERLAKNQVLKVKYLIDRKSYGQYEATVRGERDRTEVSRTTLSGREITRVPGTFGDPFRVINMLPGVSSVMSLLPLPVVRGSSPGNTGFFLDGVRLPMLFHLFGGPSVVHPEFIDHVDFYPGGFPVQYGGYTGGIVDGVTRAANKEEKRIDIDLNLAQTGVLVRQPIDALGITATAAGRYGYPGLLLSLLVPNVSLSYWDYQVRLDRKEGRHHFSVFFYGAQDDLQTRAAAGQPLRSVAKFVFHRADLRYRHGDEDDNETARLIFGYDDSNIGGGGGGVGGNNGLGNGDWSAGPQLRMHRTAMPWLQWNAGLETVVKNVDTSASSTSTTASGAGSIINQKGYFYTSGGFVEAVVKPTDELRLIPGVRADRYDEVLSNKSIHQWNIDPRLLLRYRLTDAEYGGTTLKGVVGRYHQPPRLFIPIPGLDASSLELGLLASTQYSVGAETKFGPGIESDVNVYYNDNNPVIFDLTVNPTAADVQQPQPNLPPWEPVPPGTVTQNQGLTNLFAKQQGRAYGLEILVRKRDSERLFGWVSYTLSRSERKTPTGWDLFDFDRTHMLNFVAGVRLPRNWEIGGRMLLQTGTPLTTIFGHNITRSDGQFRFDLRVDKRAVWNSWLLDFYVDVINSTVAEDTGGLIGGSNIRYIIPTIGLRGVL